MLGCIADDFTGATDLANNLVRAGMRRGADASVSPGTRWTPEAHADRVALKSRTIPAAEAIADSLAALRWLQAPRVRADLLQVLLHLRLHGRRQYRPVTEALLKALGSDFTIAMPGLPGTTSGPCSRATCLWAMYC